MSLFVFDLEARTGQTDGQYERARSVMRPMDEVAVYTDGRLCRRCRRCCQHTRQVRHRTGQHWCTGHCDNGSDPRYTFGNLSRTNTPLNCCSFV